MRNSLIKSLDCLNLFLAVREGSGIEEAKALRKRITYYDKKMAELYRDFFTITINSDSKVTERIEALLENLEIPESERGRYIGSSLTVHALLVELIEHNKENNERTKDNKLRLKSFLELVNNTSRIRWYNLISHLSLALLGVELSMIYAGAPVIEQIVTAALFVPVVSLVASIGIVSYSFYQNIFDAKKPLLERLKENFFLLINGGLTIAAKCIVIVSAPIAPPVSFILLALASGVSLLEEIMHFHQVVAQGHKMMTKKGNTSLRTLQQQARQDVDYDKRRNSMSINIFEAVLLTGIAVAWCFVPGSMFVTAGLIVASLIVSISSKMVQKYNESTMKEHLKEKFIELEQGYKKPQTPQPRVDKTNVIQGALGRGAGLEQRLVDDTKESFVTGHGSRRFFSKSPSLSSVCKANLNEDVVSYTCSKQTS